MLSLLLAEMSSSSSSSSSHSSSSSSSSSSSLPSDSFSASLSDSLTSPISLSIAGLVIILSIVLLVLARRTPIIRVTDLYVYPIKSCAGIRVPSGSLSLDRLGFLFDRRWMLISTANPTFFITQRSHPQLALIQVSLDWETLPATHAELTSNHVITVTHPDHPPLRIPMRPVKSKPITVTVWDDICDALAYDDDTISSWFSAIISMPTTLVTIIDAHQRPIDTKYDTSHGQIHSAFSDGYPILLASASSLAKLNSLIQSHHASHQRATPTVDPVNPKKYRARPAQPRIIEMRSFRPNIVVAGTLKPWSEDNWKVITIGDVTLDVVKPCSRCAIPNVDPASGERDAFNEPTRTLRQYRELKPDAVYFGQNCIHHMDSSSPSYPTIRVGDVVDIKRTERLTFPPEPAPAVADEVKAEGA